MRLRSGSERYIGQVQPGWSDHLGEAILGPQPERRPRPVPEMTSPSPALPMSEHDLKNKRWAEIQGAFLDVMDLPAEEQESRLLDLGEADAELESLVRDLLHHDLGPAPEPPPLRFGPYVTLRLLGAGGMGDVYLARRSDGAFEREVAIKVIRSELATSGVVERFLRERQTLAGLEHDSIVRLLDGGTTESGHPFLVMEYVEGESLDRFVAARALSVTDRMQLAREIAQAVGHAHERGVVHRDLKPSNILVRTDGQPRLLDFGIARSFVAPRDSGDTPPADQLTRTGHRLFTPRYASPEQIRGDEVSAATDVFALGTLLYELLAGVSPWSADASEFELEREIAESLPVAPSRRANGTARLAIAGDLDTITLKCLSQDPKHRYADASKLADDLKRALEGRTILARRSNPAERGWRLVKRRPWHALAATATFVALMSFLALLQRDRSNTSRRAELLDSIPLRLQVIEDLVADRELDLAEESLTTLTRETANVELLAADIAKIELIRARLAKQGRHWQQCLDLITAAQEIELDQSKERDAMVFFELAYERGTSLAALGRFDESETQLRLASDAYGQRFGLGDERLLGFSSLLGRVLSAMGKREEAVHELTKAREVFAPGADEHSLPLARLDLALGRALGDALRDEDAIPYFESALAAFQWHNGTRDFSATEVLVFLARSYDGVGRSAEALESSETAVQAYRELKSPLREFLALRMAADLTLRFGDLEETRLNLQRARSLLDTELTHMVDYIHENDFRQGRLELALGKPKHALKHLKDALAHWTLEGSDFGPRVRAEAQICLARALEFTGSPGEARRQRKETLMALRAMNLPEDDTLLTELIEAMGEGSGD